MTVLKLIWIINYMYSASVAFILNLRVSITLFGNESASDSLCNLNLTNRLVVFSNSAGRKRKRGRGQEGEENNII